MNKFKDIPVWENKRRLGLLKEFREHLMFYFENSELAKHQHDLRQETKKATEARRQINLKKEEVHKIVADTMVPVAIQWRPNPKIEKTDYKKLDLINNIFFLGWFEIPHTRVIDVIDQTIGVYQSNQRKSLIRTCNPIWWAGLAIKWVANLPFWLLDAAGFEEEKVAVNLSARIAKLIFLVIPLVAATLEILDLLGWLDTVKKFWK